MAASSACKVFNSTNTVVSTNTTSTLTWDTNIYDPTNMHSTSVNPENVNILTTGIYSVSVSLEINFNSLGAAAYFTVFHNNGSAVSIGTFGGYFNTAQANYWPNITVLDSFTAGDFIFVTVQNASGRSNLNILSSANFSPTMSVTFVGTVS